MSKVSTSALSAADSLRETKTVCQICEQLCSVRVYSDGERIHKIEPNREQQHWRDFCIKGSKAGMVRDHADRILTPLKKTESGFVSASYDEALDDIAARLRQISDRGNPNAIASYTGNPNGFSISNASFHNSLIAALGSTNRFWVGSIDQNALHYVAREMYGSPWFPMLPDVDDCQCLMLLGANPAVSAMNWVGSIPEGWRRVLDRPEGSDLIVVDPRLTETAKSATLHIAPLPETDWALLSAMISLIARKHGFVERAFAQADGLAEIEAIANCLDVAVLSAHCDVSVAVIERAAERFMEAETACCIARTGTAMGRHGALTEWLSHILNLVAGRIDTKGGRYFNSEPFSIADVAANIFPENSLRSRVRGTPTIAGAFPLAELPLEITSVGEGQIKALIINSGNPVTSGPDGRALSKALRELDLLVGIDLFTNDSLADADWIIPGTHWLERDEFSPLLAVGSSEPCINAGRAAVPPPEGVWTEWKFYLALADRLGLDLFPGLPEPTPEMIIDGLLTAAGLNITFQDAMAADQGISFERSEFGQLASNLAHQGGKIIAAPAPLIEAWRSALAGVSDNPGGETLRLISRRRMGMMNSWLATTAGAQMRDSRHDAVEISRKDAGQRALIDGDWVEVSNAIGALRARVIISDQVRPGVVVMEHGWSKRTGGNNRNELVSNTDLDKLTGVPRFNGMEVHLKKLDRSTRETQAAEQL